MTVRRIIFRAAVRVSEWLFLQRKIKSLYHYNLSVENVRDANHLDLITIAYNNPRVIELQSRYIVKYFGGAFTHIVVDNSTDSARAESIRAICERNGTGYVKLHKNRMNIFSGSYSHAAAVNWTYHHIIKARKPFGFGIIDHDIFPVRPMDIITILKTQPVYGVRRSRNGFWYLSAIISFFRTDFLKDKKFDFMPVTLQNTYLDSGGGNWSSIYSHLDEKGMRFMSEKMENFREGSLRHQDQVELFDDAGWVHSINASYWKKIDIVKEDILEELLRKYETVEVSS
ncbi:MAG: hypothetical protein KBS57_01150 [Alistipes sp.]|nr:hypothetical protein [Candidatus Minthomonas equi]